MSTIDPRMEAFLKASQPVAVAVRQGDMDEREAAAAIAGFIFAAGVDPTVVMEELIQVSKNWKSEVAKAKRGRAS